MKLCVKASKSTEVWLCNAAAFGECNNTVNSSQYTDPDGKEITLGVALHSEIVDNTCRDEKRICWVGDGLRASRDQKTINLAKNSC